MIEIELLDVNENEKADILCGGKRTTRSLLSKFVESGKDIMEVKWTGRYETVSSCRNSIAAMVVRYNKAHDTNISVLQRGDRIFLFKGGN